MDEDGDVTALGSAVRGLLDCLPGECRQALILTDYHSLSPGEVVRDPYLVQLAAELPPGDYRLHVGLYLLATMARLPVLDAGGTAVDDKVEVPIR